MNIRRKTVQRLLIVGLVLLLVGGGVTGGVFYLKQQRLQQVKDARTEGLEARRAGDHSRAVERLRFYHGRVQDDAETLKAHYQSLMELTGGEQAQRQVEAERVLGYYLKVKPDDVEMRLKRIELQLAAGYNTEALEQVDAILESDAGNIEAIKYRTQGLARMKKWREALEAGRKWVELQPADIDANGSVLTLLRTLKRPPQDIVKHGADLLAKHPEDGRFELIMAMSHIWAAEYEKAINMLRQASQREIDDASYVREIAIYLERLGQYEEAFDYLKRSVKRQDSSDLRALLHARLFQHRDAEQLLKQLEATESGKADTSLLAYSALALHAKGDRAKLEPVLAELGKREDDVARAWHLTLSASCSAEPNSRDVIAACQQALQLDDSNPVISLIKGQAHLRLGDRQQALDLWRASAQLAPAWPEPRVRIAKVLASLGRHTEAVNEANQARRRDPRNVSAAVALAVARWGQLESSSIVTNKDLENLLTIVNSIQKAIPRESHTLPIQVAANARLGKQDVAQAVIRTAIEAPQTLDYRLLLALQKVDRDEELGMTETLNAYANKQHGNNPSLAFSQAGDLRLQGKADAGRRLLEAGMQRNPDDRRWKRALARYLDVSQPGEALTLWKELGTSHPKDETVQKAILQSASAINDTAFYTESIERLRAITGGESDRRVDVEVSIANARLLLEAKRDADTKQAVNELSQLALSEPNNARVHLLLAEAYARIDLETNAVDSLKKAQSLGADSPEVTISLIKGLQRIGRYAESRDMLRAATMTRGLTVDNRKELAGLMLQQGLHQSAEKMLKDHRDKVDVLYPEALRRGGKVKQADEAYQRLLKARPLTFRVISYAVNFYRTQGQLEAAKAALDLLDQSEATKAEAAFLRGRFSEASGQPEAALKHYIEATNADPKDVRAWKEIINFHTRRNEYGRALAAGDKALAALPANKQLLSLLRTVQLMQAAPGSAEMTKLIEQADENDAVAATLKVLQRRRNNETTPEQMLEELKRVVNKHPRFLVARSLLIRQYLVYRSHPSASDRQAASNLMQDTLEAFPANAGVARLGVWVYRGMGRWNQVLLSARRLRSLTLDRPMEADLSIVEALVRLERREEAQETLKPYLDQMAEGKGVNAMVALQAAQLLHASGNPKGAADILRSNLDKGLAWRAAWVQLSVRVEQDLKTASTWLKELDKHLGEDASAADLQLRAEAWFHLAGRFRDQPTYAHAAELLRPLATSFQSQLMYASALEMSGQLDKAETAYRKALKSRADSKRALNNLAMVLVKLDNPEKAKQALPIIDKAISLAPNDLNLHDTRGRVLLKLSRFDDAVKAFDQARALAMNDAALSIEPLIGLADALVKSGKRDRALLVLEEIELLLKTNKLRVNTGTQAQLERVRAELKKETATTD